MTNEQTQEGIENKIKLILSEFTCLTIKEFELDQPIKLSRLDARELNSRLKYNFQKIIRIPSKRNEKGVYTGTKIVEDVCSHLNINYIA